METQVHHGALPGLAVFPGDHFNPHGEGGLDGRKAQELAVRGVKVVERGRPERKLGQDIQPRVRLDVAHAPCKGRLEVQSVDSAGDAGTVRACRTRGSTHGHGPAVCGEVRDARRRGTACNTGVGRGVAGVHHGSHGRAPLKAYKPGGLGPVPLLVENRPRKAHAHLINARTLGRTPDATIGEGEQPGGVAILGPAVAQGGVALTGPLVAKLVDLAGVRQDDGDAKGQRQVVVQPQFCVGQEGVGDLRVVTRCG